MPQASVTTPFTVYDLNVGTIVDMEDVIAQLDPADVPLLGMNGADGGYTIPRIPVFEIKHEWLDDTLLTPRCTVANAMLSTDTSTVLAAGDANRFGVGTLLMIEAEYIYVTAVSADGLTLTLSRGFGGSTAAAHATGKAIVGLGLVLNEGSQPGKARAVDRSNRYNLTQIVGPELVSVSGTEMVVRKYGLNGTTEFAYQGGQRAKELFVGLEQALYYGIRTSQPSQATDSRSMGGFTYFVVTHADSSTTTITFGAVNDRMQDCYSSGGHPTEFLCSPKIKRAISKFTDDAGADILRRNATDTARGEVVSTLQSDFGDLNVRMSRWLRDQDAFGYDRDQLALGTLRPMQFELLAKTGDSVQGEFVGEYTMVVRRERHCFRFSALTG